MRAITKNLSDFILLNIIFVFQFVDNLVDPDDSADFQSSLLLRTVPDFPYCLDDIRFYFFLTVLSGARLDFPEDGVEPPLPFIVISQLRGSTRRFRFWFLLHLILLTESSPSMFPRLMIIDGEKHIPGAQQDLLVESIISHQSLESSGYWENRGIS